MTEEKHKAHLRARPTSVLKPPRIDWRQIVADITQHGCSLHRISLELGVEYSTAQRWRNIRDDIGYGYGRALIRLHARICGAALTLQRLSAADDCAYTSRA